MRSFLASAMRAGAMSATLFLGAGAAAQTVDTGNEVQVNPGAVGGTTLLYPGGAYMRVVPQLLQPGQRPTGPIHLHMPRRHVAHAARPAKQAAAPAEQSVAAIAPAPPPPAPKPKPAPVLHPAPPPAIPRERIPAGGGYAGGAAGLFSNMSGAPAPGSQVASAMPAPAHTLPGMTKRSVILFAPKSADPADSALDAIKFLAGDLNAAMTGPKSRVEIQAFGGAHGDKGSDARRLSLKRALAIRQVLIDDGVPAERIDVRAMGGADDTGPADRVDVYIRA